MRIYMMCGIPGSGKTTVAKQLNLPIVSLDDIREEWYGDASIQGDGNKIYQEALTRIKKYVIMNQDVVYDATNVQAARRIAFVKRFPKADIICIYVNTSLNTSLLQNDKRTRHVPEEVINRMYYKLETPIKQEGFKKIITIQ